MTAPAWAAESLRPEHGLHGGGTVILDDGPTPKHSCRPAFRQSVARWFMNDNLEVSGRIVGDLVI